MSWVASGCKSFLEALKVCGLKVLRGFSIPPLQSEEEKAVADTTSEDANVAPAEESPLSTNMKEAPQTESSEPSTLDEEHEEEQISSSSDDKNKKQGFFTRMAKKVGGGKKSPTDAWRPHTTWFASYNNFSVSVKKKVVIMYGTVQQSVYI